MKAAFFVNPSTHVYFYVVNYAPVAQLDRASDFGSEGLGFESLRAY